jgi:hypothetical protein
MLRASPHVISRAHLLLGWLLSGVAVCCSGLLAAALPAALMLLLLQLSGVSVTVCIGHAVLGCHS